MGNSSLDNTMQMQQQGIDPFAQARQMQQSRSQSPTDVMGNPFGSQQAQPQMPADGPQLGQAVGGQPSSFMALAQQHGIQTDSLHSDPQVAKLQLMSQLQAKHGPDFMQHPATQPLLAAFDAHAQQPNAQAANASSATAQRTLGALMR